MGVRLGGHHSRSTSSSSYPALSVLLATAPSPGAPRSSPPAAAGVPTLKRSTNSEVERLHPALYQAAPCWRKLELTPLIVSGARSTSSPEGGRHVHRPRHDRPRPWALDDAPQLGGVGPVLRGEGLQGAHACVSRLRDRGRGAAREPVRDRRADCPRGRRVTSARSSASWSSRRSSSATRSAEPSRSCSSTAASAPQASRSTARRRKASG